MMKLLRAVRLIDAAFFVSVMLAAASGFVTVAADDEVRIEPLLPEVAFKVRGHIANGDAVVIYTLPKDIYLYKERIALTTAHKDVRIGNVQLPAGEELEDIFFGKTTVFFDGVTIRAPLQTAAAVNDFELIVLSQGCDKQIGICYPPMEQTLAILFDASTTPADSNNTAAAQDESSALSQVIANRNIFAVMAIFFLLGVGLSLTPCVLPMLPILFGVIGGAQTNQATPPRRRVVMLTGSYIAGTVTAFTALGLLAGFSGALLTVAIQKPVILISFALFLSALSAALFLGYAFQLPAFLQNKLNSQQGGSGSSGSSGSSLAGAFAMGVTATTIASPCVAPPLIGALLYIGSTGDAISGGLSLFSLGLGMSVLLAVAGIGGGALLPKAGAWMEGINRFFAVLLLITAVWVASPLLSSVAQLLMYGVLLLLAGLLAAPFAAPKAESPSVVYLVKAGALALVVWGAVMLIGAAAGSRDVLTPLSVFTRSEVINNNVNNDSTATDNAGDIAFEMVDNLPALQTIIAQTNKPLLVEFYADWCVSCKEFERFTLTDERVQARLQNTRLLRIDVTANNESDRALLKHYALFGPPALLFYTSTGKQQSHLRLIGFENADDFLQRLGNAGIGI